MCALYILYFSQQLTVLRQEEANKFISFANNKMILI